MASRNESARSVAKKARKNSEWNPKEGMERFDKNLNHSVGVGTQPHIKTSANEVSLAGAPLPPRFKEKLLGTRFMGDLFSKTESAEYDRRAKIKKNFRKELKKLIKSGQYSTKDPYSKSADLVDKS